MEMPKPTDAHKKLEQLVGTWAGDDKVFASQWSTESLKPTVCDVRSALDGFFLLMEYAEHTDGKVTYGGHGVIGYDAKNSCYTMHWFDNWGTPPSNVGRGQWVGDTLTFDWQYPDHKSRVTYTLDGGELIQRVEMDMDGKGFKPVIEGKYKKA
ncbi:MAG: DUF1579 family protein [Planctomycetes bacterium]|nr:DUF1579 family protein [Planctomycetota bacterium]